MFRSLKGKIKKKEFLGFDIETEGEENTFVSCAIWGHDRELFFTNKQECINYMCSTENKGYTFVATNLSFDFAGIYWDTEEWNNFKILFRGSRIMLAELKIGNKKGSISYVDTMNYAPFGVATLGKIIEHNKLEAPEWLGERKPESEKEWKEYKEYNMQDAKISCLFVEYLQNSLNELGGNIKISIASCALDLYRRKFFNGFLIKETHTLGEWVKDFIYDGYYGGRTEVFSRGLIKDYNYYDINSLYPSVMKNKFPLPNSVKRIYEPSLEYIEDFEGVSECLVTAPNLKYPLLPVRKDDKLLFPIGNFKGVWNHNELRKAIELGYKIIPTKQIIYTRTFYPFKEYVDVLYNKRLKEKEKKSFMEIVLKLLLNSLYGKFAQRNVEEYIIKTYNTLSKEERKDLLINENSMNVDLIGNMYVKRTPKECNGVFVYPILSSYTTSYARLKLYEYISKYEPVYCDTDSIITKHEMKQSKYLGEMKLEKKIKEGIIIKPKLYYDGEEVKAKGIKKATLEDFNEILLGNHVEKMNFMTIKSGLIRGMLPNTIFYTPKKVDLNDTKRNWKEEFSSIVIQESTPLIIKVET